MKKILTIVLAFVGVQVASAQLGAEAKSNSVAQPAPNTEDYRLVWSDEFDGSELAPHWVMEEGYIANNELQDYQKSGNHSLSGGTLKITAKKLNDKKEFGSYTSARMNTNGTKAFTYGRIEARMRLPLGVGVWPAFWMLGTNIAEAGWPLCGEIDILEYVGYDPGVVHGTLHSEDYNHGKGTQRGHRTEVDNEAHWHTYGTIWTEEGFWFYVDDPAKPFWFCPANEVKTPEAWPFDAPHFLILNLAVGGGWGGLHGIDNSLFPATMEVDYVRVYQK